MLLQKFKANFCPGPLDAQSTTAIQPLVHTIIDTIALHTRNFTARCRRLKPIRQFYIDCVNNTGLMPIILHRLAKCLAAGLPHPLPRAVSHNKHLTIEKPLIYY